MKKAVCLVLAIVFMLSALPARASAEVLPFTDVASTDSFYDAVLFCYMNGLVSGTSHSEFSPQRLMTRAEFVTVLGRMAVRFCGEELESVGEHFADVEAGKYYAPYVDWAYEASILDGAEALFMPNEPISGVQAEAMLGKYSAHVGLRAWSGVDEAFSENRVTRAQAAGVFMSYFQALEQDGIVQPSVMEISGLRVSRHEWEFYYNWYVQTNWYLLESYGYIERAPGGIFDEAVYTVKDSEIREIFEDLINSSIIEVKALYFDAVAHGVIDAGEGGHLLYGEDMIFELGDELAKQYLQTTYGEGMTLAEYRRICRENRMAAQHSLNIHYGFTYTEQDYEQYYAENAELFDFFTYHLRYFFADSMSEDRQAAYDAASEMLSRITDEQSFRELSFEYMMDDSLDIDQAGGQTLRHETLNFKGIAPVVKEWLIDEARQPGDTAIVEDEYAVYVVMFFDRGRDEHNTRDVMHILFGHNDDSRAAEETAELVYEKWLAGEATAESFAELAEVYSDDTGVLYTEVYQGQMVEGFDDWLFDSERVPGDSGIVESLYGYHIMLFIGDNRPFWVVLVDNQLRFDEHDRYMEALCGQYTVIYK